MDALTTYNIRNGKNHYRYHLSHNRNEPVVAINILDPSKFELLSYCNLPVMQVVGNKGVEWTEYKGDPVDVSAAVAHLNADWKQKEPGFGGRDPGFICDSDSYQVHTINEDSISLCKPKDPSKALEWFKENGNEYHIEKSYSTAKFVFSRVEKDNWYLLRFETLPIQKELESVDFGEGNTTYRLRAKGRPVTSPMSMDADTAAWFRATGVPINMKNDIFNERFYNERFRIRGY